MTVVDDPAPSFSAALRAATWADHQRAEQAPYVRALVAGELDLEGYARMVDQHWHIYRELEAASATMQADPVAGAFVAPELLRLGALEADLAALRGPEWAARSEPLPATTAYCERLRDVAHDWPGGFVAHHYTRYLGDLSGGQFIGRVVRRHHDLGDAGTAFYRFDGIDDPAAYRAAYRDRLDAAAWDPGEQARIIDEIGVAYALNTAVFDDLSATLDR